MRTYCRRSSTLGMRQFGAFLPVLIRNGMRKATPHRIHTSTAIDFIYQVPVIDIPEAKKKRLPQSPHQKISATAMLCDP